VNEITRVFDAPRELVWREWLAATLEFLRAIDYDFPAWAEEYMTRMEAVLGEPYSEPAGDVRGYIAQVKSQAA
jgi:glutathione S-transferase